MGREVSREKEEVAVMEKIVINHVDSLEVIDGTPIVTLSKDASMEEFEMVEVFLEAVKRFNRTPSMDNDFYL